MSPWTEQLVSLLFGEQRINIERVVANVIVGLLMESETTLCNRKQQHSATS